MPKWSNYRDRLKPANARSYNDHVKETLSFVDVIDVERLWEVYRDLGNSLDLEETLSVLDHDLARVIPYQAISVHLEDRCVYAAGEVFAKLAESSPDVPAPGFPIAARVTLLREGRTIGTLSLYRAESSDFTEHDRATLGALAPKLAACLENARNYRCTEAARKRALFERLDAEIARIKRSHGNLAVLDCSVDRMDPGGPLPERIACELRRACREYDFIAPGVSGFLVVLIDFAPAGLDDTKARIRRVFQDAGLHVRIGAALLPVDGYDAEDLLSAAHGAAHV